MVVLKEIVDRGLMEISSGSNSGASDRSATLLGETSLVVTEVVGIVFRTLGFKFSEALFGVGAGGGGRPGNVSRGVSQVGAVGGVKLGLVNNSEVIGVLLAVQIVVNTRFGNGEDAVGLHYVSEKLRVRAFSAGNIGMVSLDHVPVCVFDLLRSGS